MGTHVEGPMPCITIAFLYISIALGVDHASCWQHLYVLVRTRFYAFHTERHNHGGGGGGIRGSRDSMGPMHADTVVHFEELTWSSSQGHRLHPFVLNKGDL